MLSACVPPGSCMARVLLFTGGPCTEGAGKVVDRALTEEIRSHKDLAKDAVPHFRKAKKYYDALAAEMVAHGHICDAFSCALDNVRFALCERMCAVIFRLHQLLRSPCMHVCVRARAHTSCTAASTLAPVLPLPKIQQGFKLAR